MRSAERLIIESQNNSHSQNEKTETCRFFVFDKTLKRENGSRHRVDLLIVVDICGVMTYRIIVVPANSLPNCTSDVEILPVIFYFILNVKILNVCSILSSIPYLPISTDIYDRFFTKNRIGQTASVNAENRTVCRFSPFKSISKPIVPTLLCGAYSCLLLVYNNLTVWSFFIHLCYVKIK